MIEVGPGPGGLTRGLLAEARAMSWPSKGCPRPARAGRDRRRLSGPVTVINGDALEIDPLAHLTPPIRIVANLPYNVGTELLIRWLTAGGIRLAGSR